MRRVAYVCVANFINPECQQYSISFPAETHVLLKPFPAEYLNRCLQKLMQPDPALGVFCFLYEIRRQIVVS